MGEEGAGLSMDVVATEIGMALFDLSLSLSEIGDDLRGFLEYNCDLFDATTIGRMGAQLRRLARSVVADPAQRLSRLPLLAAAERHQLESEWSTPAARPAEATGDPWLPSLVDAWVERTPEAVAVLGDQSPGQPGEVLRYAELGRRAALLAGWLRRCGFGPESLAGIALEPGPELVVALLAVLEAGGAYLPLDPALPRQRLEYMVEDSGASALLTQQHLRAKLPPVSGPCLCLDDGWQTAAGEATAGEAPPRPESPAADSLAYATYTSGSTGRPKGVQITHRSLVNFLLSMRRRPGLEAADRVLAVTSLSFDISALELFLPLITGASVELVSRETAADGALLADRVRQSTVVQATPATWRLLLAGGWIGAEDLKVLCGGEALTPSLAAELVARSASVWNMYGPTETTVWSSVHAVGAEHPGDAAVSIGRPIDRTDLRVVDRGLQTQPIGVLGELLIGGAGLSRGYRGRPALTAERFVPDPFGARPGERLYRTGDLARWGGAGRLDFHGRLDHQTKVRGFRIEPGEIEAVLGEHPQVRAAAVLAREDVPGLSAPGEPLLAAYVVAAAEIAELRRFLRERLPDYMVPKAFVELEELPLTPSGKVDRAALPRPEGPSSVAELVPPRSSREELLVEIWRQVLGFSGQLGVHDNFFDIGGHSLLATRMVSQIREFFGVDLPVRAVFEAPTVAGLAEHLEAPGAVASVQPIALAKRSEELPLSYSQLREWFLYQLEPGNPAYHIPATIELRGPLDYRVFERSCNEAVRRHETLRTTFRPATAEAGTASVIDGAPSGGQPVVQVIAPRRDLRVPVVDLTALPAEPRAAVARRLAAAVILLPFDLVNGPLVRIGLLRVGPQEHTVCLAMHHIISDAWSMGILIREVTELYGAYLAGRPSPLPELKVQYADYVIAQRRWLRGETLERLVSYWRQRLDEEPPVLRLPVDRPRTARTIPRSEWWPLAFDAETTAEIRGLCQRSRTSLFMTSLAAFQTLLGRTTGQDDVAVGTFIAGRNRPEIEPLIGFFVNSLVLRSDLSGEPSFRELLERVREVTLGAYEHQDLPFEMLLDRLQIERSLSHTPLFQVMLAMQNLPTYNRQQEGLSLIPVGVGGQRSQFELTLWLEESDGVLSGNMEYNAESFDLTTVRRICGHFQVLLRGAVKDPDQPISTLPLMSRGERQQLLCEWSRTPDSVTGEPSFQELFEAQVSRLPDAPALFDPTTGEELSYRQLDERSNRLAHHLRRLGVAAESLVGLLLARSCDLVVGILGILKAGGAYVPLDPDYPRERLKLVARDARLALLLTHRQLAGELLELAGGDPAVVAMDLDGERIAACPADPPAAAAGSSAAYVSYTSGSTGRPKGVVVSQRSLAWYAAAAIEHYGLVQEDRVLQLSSISFDISVEEIFPCLARGATLVLRRDETIASAGEFYRDCRDWGITVAAPPTAFWHELAAAGTGDPPPSLRLMSVGGERMLPQRVADWRRSGGPAVQLMNTYGPTETTVVATLYKVAGGTDGFRGEVPIGRPVPRAEVYVLDGDGRMLPSGAVGELCIGGDGVARGYLGQGAATAERFVPHPWTREPGERLYRTGDLARFASDGNLQFLGRTDHQVKIRGFRVEPGEIEALIVRHPGVRDAAVVAFEPQPAQRRLAAYVVPRDAEIAAGELRDFLAASLPEHMVPAVFVTLETLPLTPGGKVDRRALPEPDQPGGGGAEYVAPSTPSEEILAEILCELLGVERVSVYDSFFDLGGHSLLATQYRSRIREAFAVELPLQAFFETPSIARLAVRIEELILAELEAEADDA
jgi:amino acid adenylation domain-containing protein